LDTLAPPSKSNAQTEGATALTPTNTLTTRVGNWTQISEKVVSISDTTDAVSTVGKGEFARQLANVMAEIKTDQEASIVSNNASVGGATRVSAGMESWIKTSAVENGGTTGGFASSLVPAPTDATLVVVTEAMVQTLASNLYNNGGKIKELIASPAMKSKLSAILGSSQTRYNNAKDRQVTSTVDTYISDFGEFSISPHRSLRTQTIIAYDPDLWSVATLKGYKTEELAKVGLSRQVMLSTEWTLESRNEAGNGKIANVKTA
jgi:hypothetical protein